MYIFKLYGYGKAFHNQDHPTISFLLLIIWSLYKLYVISVTKPRTSCSLTRFSFTPFSLPFSPLKCNTNKWANKQQKSTEFEKKNGENIRKYTQHRHVLNTHIPTQTDRHSHRYSRTLTQWHSQSPNAPQPTYLEMCIQPTKPTWKIHKETTKSFRNANVTKMTKKVTSHHGDH